MKKYIILILLTAFCPIQGQTPDTPPLPTDPVARKEELKKRIGAPAKQPDGYVFKPTKDYPEDKEIEIRLNAPPICARRSSQISPERKFL